MCIHPQTLPPTSHLLQNTIASVYIYKYKNGKVVVLKCNQQNGSEGKLMPVLTDLPPAPDELLKMISVTATLIVAEYEVHV